MSSLMIQYAYMRTTYEELMKYKMKKQFSWEKQTQVMTKLRTWTVKTFSVARGRLKIELKITNSVQESFSNFISVKK